MHTGTTGTAAENAADNLAAGMTETQSLVGDTTDQTGTVTDGITTRGTIKIEKIEIAKQTGIMTEETEPTDAMMTGMSQVSYAVMSTETSMTDIGMKMISTINSRREGCRAPGVLQVTWVPAVVAGRVSTPIRGKADVRMLEMSLGTASSAGANQVSH